MKKTKRIIPESDSSLKRFYRNHPVLVNFLAICLSGFVFILLVFWFFNVYTHHGDSTTIPDVENMSYIEAVNTLRDAGLVPEIADSVYDQNLPPGTIKNVWPSAGSIVKPGRSVFLKITSFQPEMVTINGPVKYQAERQAVSTLNRNNIKNILIRYVDGEFADLVVRALYNGKEIFPGMKIPVNATVILEVSTGNRYAASEPAAPGDSLKTEVEVPESSVHSETEVVEEPSENPLFD